MTVLDRLDPTALCHAMGEFRDALRAHQANINRLNVYPVPDGDTGTNMALTLESVVAEIDALNGDPNDGGPDVAAVCHAIGHGSLMGARGNSGVILSQVMRGFTGVVRDAAAVDAAVVADGLVAASRAAYEAVMRPVEGTILTVVREASEAASEAATAGGTLVAVLDAARSRAVDALARTPELLPVLADAGVVDAGGSGFVLFLDALLHVVDGRPVPHPTADEGIVSETPHLVGEQPHGHGEGHGHDGDVGDLRYEVMYFLEAPDAAIPAFKDVWAGVGDSIVVVGGEGLWNCHIHTDDIGAAIEAAIDIGRPRQIRVTDLMEQVEEERWVREGAAEADPGPPPEPVPCAVVAVATGAGVQRILRSLGVHQVVAGGQSMNPSTAQLLEAVEAAPGEQVVILPNNKNIVAVAEQVDAQTTKEVRVVRTHSVVEGLAALLAYDPESTAESNLGSMTAACGAVAAGEVTRAVRDATCEVGPVRAGQYIGIAPDGIRAVGDEVADAAVDLLDHLVGDDHELVTILEGDGSSAAATRRITEWLAEHRPDVEPEVHQGGQPLYPYLFGVE